MFTRWPSIANYSSSGAAQDGKGPRKRRFRAQVLSWVVVLLAMAGLGTQATAQHLNHTAPDEAIIEGVFHIKMTAATQSALSAADGTIERMGVPSLDQLAQQHQVDRLERIFRTDPRHAERHARWGLDRWYRVYTTTQGIAAARSAVQAFHEDPNIELAEHVLAKVHTGLTMDPVVEALGDRFEAAEARASSAATSDPLFDDQWHYNNTGQRFGTAGADIQLLDAWAIETGAPEVIVQVVDSGMEITHPDLAANLWTNPCETENGQDDCGNGYVDDVYGYNFANNNADIAPNDPQDKGDSHGIHVAGTIAAVTDNDIGVAGVAGGDGSESSGVRIMTAQNLSDVNGGSAEAIIYGADNGAVISNNSWGYVLPGFVEQAVLDAIDYFAAEAGGADAPVQGGLVIFAAGNDNATGEWYPAFYETAMAVGSTDNNDDRSSFSNYGDWVEIAAPGGGFFAGVWSTLHTAIDGGYGTMQGTSMAAPHVAGVAALVASQRPGISADNLRTLLRVSADDIVTDRPIGPRLNAFTALDVASTPPDAIQDLTIIQPSSTVPGARLSLQWTATGAAGDRGQASAYDLRYSTEGPITTEADFEAATAVADLPTPQPSGTAESFTVEGLPFAEEVYLSIRAVDLVGNVSDLSNSPSGATGSQPVASFAPEALAPTIDVNATKTITLEVRNEGPAGSTLYFVFEEVASDTSSSAALSTEPADELIRSISPLQGEVPVGDAMVVELELDATAIDAGTYQRELAVTTNDPETATQTIPVTITVEAVPPKLAVEPETLDFGAVPRNGSDALVLAVSNEGGDELIISGWTIDSGAFTLDAEAPIVLPFDAPAPEELDVTFAPDATGPTSARVTFETNNPDAPLVEVDLIGEGVPSPELIATPTLFDETVDFGTSVNRSLTIENAGDGDLLMDIVYAADGTDVSASDVAAVSATPSTPIMPDSESTLQSRRPLEAPHAAGGDDGAAAVESASPFVYQLDDGVMNRALTFGAGDIMWINAFESVRGATVITSLAAAWGAGISIGDPVELLLYDDPTNNGDPSDAELLEVVSTTISTTTTNDFQEVAIPPTVVTGSFFVAALYRGDRDGLNPAPLDEGDPQGASWIAGSLFTGGIDIENPAGSDRGLNKIDAFGFPGNWLLRANGAPDIVEFAPMQATVGPGESTDITVTLKGTGVDPGSYSGTIRLLSNDPQQPVVPVPTDVTVESVPPRLSVHPAEVAFGPVAQDTVVTDTLSITNAGLDVLDITTIELEGSAFNLTHLGDDPPFNLVFGDTALVAVTFQPEAAGPVEGSLSLTHTGENESPFTVPLTGRAVAPVLTMSPEAFTDTTFTGESLELEQQLTNGATEVASLVVELDVPAFLELGEVSGTGVTVDGTELTLAPQASATVRYLFEQGSPGQYEGVVRLLSNDPAAPETSIPVDLTVVEPPPVLSVQPDQIAAGTLPVGAVARDTVKIMNEGGRILEIAEIQAEGAGWAFDIGAEELPLSLTPDDTVLVAVTFQPEGAGPAEGSLSLTHTGENESPFTVPLTGRAVAPVLTMSPGAFTDTTFTGESLELEQQLTNGATEVASLVVDLDLPPFLELGEIAGTGVTVEGTQLTLAPLSNATVHYTFAQTVSEATDFEDSVVLATNDPERPDVNVPVAIHIPHPISVNTPLEDLALAAGEAPMDIDTGGVFISAPDETVTLTAESSDPAVASVALLDQSLRLSPRAVGQASITLRATAASGATGATTFNVAIDRMVASPSIAFGDIERPGSYRLVGLPGQMGDDLASTLSGEPGTTWRAFRETGADGGDPEDYLVEYDGTEAFRFGPGRGFWLLSREGWAVEATVDAVELTEEGLTSVPLHEGWNIISNPLDQPVGWEATLALAANDGLVQGLWQWDGSWQPADTLRSARAGEAYYLYNNGDLEMLTLQHPAAADAGDPALVAAASPRGEALTLMAALETGEAGLQQIGQVTLGRADAPHAHRLPPSHFTVGQLYAIGEDTDAPLGRLLHRTDGEREGHAYDLTLEVEAGAAVHLSAAGLAAFAGEGVVLVTPGGQRHDLTALGDGETVRYLLETDTAQLQLLIGNAAFIDAVAGRPEALAFGPVYPNPSSGEVTVEVAVPEPMAVQVALFNVLGQQIALLHSGPLTPGVHELHWDGQTPGAGVAASGVYLLRLTGANGQQDVTRLTRVR